MKEPVVQFLLIFLLILPFSVGALQPKPAKFVIFEDQVGDTLKFATSFFDLVFQGLPEYKYSLVPLPSERAEMELADPSVVGDAIRGISFSARHPDLIPVELPFKNVPISCIVRVETRISKCTKENLKGLKIGKMFGSHTIEKFLAANGLVPSIEYNSTDQSLELLVRGRVDVTFGVEELLLKSAVGQKYAGKYKIAGQLTSIKTYAFLKPEFKDLADRMEKRMRQLKSNGPARDSFFSKMENLRSQPAVPSDIQSMGRLEFNVAKFPKGNVQ